MYIAPTTAPKSVEASVTSSGITVKWEALHCDCNGVITGYSVQCEQKDGKDKQERHVPSDTTEFTFGRLISSTTYSFSVAAKNSSGIGVYSVPKSEETKDGGLIHSWLLLHSSWISHHISVPADLYASTEHYTG